MADNQFTLLTLPIDLHVEILSFVPARQVLVYSRCCKYCKTVTEDDRVWGSKEIIVLESSNKEKPVPWPASRLCHTATVYNDALYIYGGDAAKEDKIVQVKNDLWAFRFTEGGRWDELRGDNTPRPLLTEHSSVLDGDSLFTFGGNCGSQEGGSAFILGNTVHKVDLATGTVRDIKCTPATTTSTAPGRRSAHSAVFYDGEMYVFGGWDGNNSFGDFFALDVSAAKWRQIKGTGDAPSPRRAHCAVVYDHYMFIFGGYDKNRKADEFKQMHRYDFATNSWETFHGTGDVPAGRSRASMVVYQDKIYVVGGWNRDKSEYYADLYEFNINTHQWRLYKSPSLKTQVKGICQHKCVVYKHWLLITGGHTRSTHESTNKIFAINLRKKATK